jgi:hypothetical protein
MDANSTALCDTGTDTTASFERLGHSRLGQPLYDVLGGTVRAAAAVSLGYFLWASISLVEHWVGRVSLFVLAALALALLLCWAYRRATRGEGSDSGTLGPDDQSS